MLASTQTAIKLPIMSFLRDVIRYLVLNEQLFNLSICRIHNNSQNTKRSFLLRVCIRQADAYRHKQVAVSVKCVLFTLNECHCL
jgi:hypothetical protein